MLRLLVLRHAKSDWTADAPRDFDRPLNARGRKAGPLVGAHIAAHGLQPDRILCSPALRTRQTLELIRPHLAAAPEVAMLPELYDDSEHDYLDILRAHGGDAACLMLVGHNPASQDTVLALAGAGEPGLLAQARRKFPTATLAVIDLEIDTWSAITPGCGRLAGLAEPRHLPSPRDLSAHAGGV